MMPDPLLRRHATEAVARHASAAPVIRAVAAELGPREGRPWLAMADALARGDLSAAAAAAARDPGCWMPLFSTPAGDPRLWGRIVAAAGGPAGQVESGWTMLAYPIALAILAIGLPYGLSVVMVPLFAGLFDNWDLELPLVTQWVLWIAGFMRSVWKPLVAAGLIVVSGWALARWWMRRGPVVAAAFTRHLARLVEAGVPRAEAVELAARAVRVPAVSPARPRRPLSHAAVAALAYDPPVAGGLLDAVADCHALRAVDGTGAAWNIFRTLAYWIVFVVVGFYVLALFRPLIHLFWNLS
jgi:hypothetical protein